MRITIAKVIEHTPLEWHKRLGQAYAGSFFES